jgi:tetratricopeptide (TPR) repeat protein
MKKIINLILVITVVISTSFVSNLSAQTVENNQEERQKLIIEKYLKNGAWNHHFLSKEWEEWIDLGLHQDSTIAYLWQQKALPYWKQKKYTLAIDYYDKAVKYDRKQWLSRRAFLKCIFSKDYKGAIEDFELYKKEFGMTYEQDHPIDFYIGMCYLQLNQFDLALRILHNNIEDQISEHGDNWPHYLDRYYLAIAFFENQDYNSAILQFDLVLKEYTRFSDAQYFRAICLHKIGQNELALSCMKTGKSNFEKGLTFNEDSNQYESYPYQLTWQWKSAFEMLK